MQAREPALARPPQALGSTARATKILICSRGRSTNLLQGIVHEAVHHIAWSPCSSSFVPPSNARECGGGAIASKHFLAALSEKKLYVVEVQRVPAEREPGATGHSGGASGADVCHALVRLVYEYQLPKDLHSPAPKGLTSARWATGHMLTTTECQIGLVGNYYTC
jgi:hypothetical protein